MIKHKILVAPDSFKGSISSMEICDLVEEVCLKHKFPFEIIKMPISDGGEGFLDSFRDDDFESYYLDTTDLDGVPVNVEVLANQQEGVYLIEMAKVCGLHQNKRHANPMNATTYGLGLLFKQILNLNPNRIIFGVGGTGTNDAGVGFLQALGYNFLDQDGNEIGHGLRELSKLKVIETNNAIQIPESVEIIVATDVKSPLLGPSGATYTFGPQKGLKPEDLEMSEQYFLNYVRINPTDTNQDFAKIQGSGAAGGLPYSLISFLGAKIESGIDIVMEYNNFDSKLEESLLVMSGEGFSDWQTAQGKVISGIVSKSNSKEVPVINICGGYSNDILHSFGWEVPFFSIQNQPMTLEDSVSNATKLLSQTVFSILKTIQLIMDRRKHV